MSETENCDRSASSNLMPDGFTVVEGLMDPSLIARVDQTLSGFVTQMAFFTTRTTQKSPKCPWTSLPWGSDCENVVENFEQVSPEYSYSRKPILR